MEAGRREFCLAGITALSSQATLGQVSAQSSITVSGTVRSEAGTDVTGVEIRLSNVSNDQFNSTFVESTGEFNLSVETSGQYRVTMFDESNQPNKIPVIYSFDNAFIENAGDIGELVIPEAYQTEIRMVNQDGNPIEGLPIAFRAENGTGVSPGSFTTNSNGYVKRVGAADPGVELTSPTTLMTHETSETAEEATEIQTLFVTERSAYEFTISTDESTGSTASSTRSGDSSRQRGLISNGQAGGDSALSNPTNLTTLGFLLSVGGIAYQLIEGR